MGAAIARGEALLRAPGRSSRADLLSGALLTTSIVAGSYLASNLLLKFTRKQSPHLADATELTLAWTCVAGRNLHDEASAVLAALDAGDLPAARRQLSRIVGRDTASLHAQEISRAVIETVAESLSDGVLAPLFYLAVGGVPLGLAYKAVNTLDSMIGHADNRYFYFGKFAARLDDVANLVPARLTALMIASAAAALSSCKAISSVNTWRADHSRHKSPNAGHPESAMAGALAVRLGGENCYAGEWVKAPHLGKNFPAPNATAARTSLRIAALATSLGVALFALLTWNTPRGSTR